MDATASLENRPRSEWHLTLLAVAGVVIVGLLGAFLVYQRMAQDTLRDLSRTETSRAAERSEANRRYDELSSRYQHNLDDAEQSIWARYEAAVGPVIQSARLRRDHPDLPQPTPVERAAQIMDPHDGSYLTIFPSEVAVIRDADRLFEEAERVMSRLDRVRCTDNTEFTGFRTDGTVCRTSSIEHSRVIRPFTIITH